MTGNELREKFDKARLEYADLIAGLIEHMTEAETGSRLDVNFLLEGVRGINQLSDAAEALAKLQEIGENASALDINLSKKLESVIVVYLDYMSKVIEEMKEAPGREKSQVDFVVKMMKGAALLVNVVLKFETMTEKKAKRD